MSINITYLGICLIVLFGKWTSLHAPTALSLFNKQDTNGDKVSFLQESQPESFSLLFTYFKTKVIWYPYCFIPFSYTFITTPFVYRFYKQKSCKSHNGMFPASFHLCQPWSHLKFLLLRSALELIASTRSMFSIISFVTLRLFQKSWSVLLLNLLQRAASICTLKIWIISRHVQTRIWVTVNVIQYVQPIHFDANYSTVFCMKSAPFYTKLYYFTRFTARKIIIWFAD